MDHIRLKAIVVILLLFILANYLQLRKADVVTESLQVSESSEVKLKPKLIPKQSSEELYYINNEKIRVKYWKWTGARSNILFIKIPKTGGTTLADGLGRLANHSQWVLAKPVDRAQVRTCGAEPEAMTNWQRMIYANGGRIGIFASHACFRSFMKYRKYWSIRKQPITITLMRDPWNHYISKFRFTQVCCEREWSWCATICPKDASGNRVPLTHTYFLDTACKNGRCNEQRFYMGSGPSDKILSEFSFVLILERLDEGLALLGVKLGLPFEALPYLRENRNTIAKMPNFTMNARKKVQSTELGADFDLYRAASTRLDAQLTSLGPAQKQQYQQVLSRLQSVNKQLTAVCESKCLQYESLSKERKSCDHACIEEFLENLEVIESNNSLKDSSTNSLKDSLSTDNQEEEDSESEEETDQEIEEEDI